ncbi:MAG: triose-phosphate isomerase [bacterium]
MIFINLKTYQNGTGRKALEFLKQAEAVHQEIGIPITILAQAVDIRLFAENTSLPIWSQHLDNVDYGKNTGWTLPEAVIEAGAKGTMINHAEHKIPLADVSNIVERFKTDNFQIMISTTSPEETIIMDQLKPQYVTYEPQEYIGTKISVVDVAPDIIRNITQKIQTPLVIGAGIHTPQQIVEGLLLGAKGFLISSDILNSDNPPERLKEYMLAYKNAYNTIN